MKENGQDESEGNELQPGTASLWRRAHGEHQTSQHDHEALLRPGDPPPKCSLRGPGPLGLQAGHALMEREPEILEPAKRYSLLNPAESVKVKVQIATF